METRATDNMLYQLAETLGATEKHATAIALRRLAQAGYVTLEEIDTAPDWVLLATPGIGIGRLGMVRRLIRLDWQPPSQKAALAAQWFFTTVRFALRFWSVEALASTIEGSMPALMTDHSMEKRLALTTFSEAARRALCYDGAEAWILALQQYAQTRDGQAHGRHEICQALGSEAAALIEGQQQPAAVALADMDKTGTAGSDSDHYAFSSEKRQQIVESYRLARKNGEVESKEAWAYNTFRISRKTLWRYEQEFPEMEHVSLYSHAKHEQENEQE